jgi:hypothetical protein
MVQRTAGQGEPPVRPRRSGRGVGTGQGGERGFWSDYVAKPGNAVRDLLSARTSPGALSMAEKASEGIMKGEWLWD